MHIAIHKQRTSYFLSSSSSGAGSGSARRFRRKEPSTCAERVRSVIVLIRSNRRRMIADSAAGARNEPYPVGYILS